SSRRRHTRSKRDWSSDVCSSDLFTDDGVKYHDLVNYLKGGINFSDRVTTVSPTYANEITTPEFGEGLDDVIRHNRWKLRGIINGIDYDSNNPETDPLIPHHFSTEDISGKTKNKLELQRRLGLPENPDVPIIGMVSRLTDQKGFQLIEEKLMTCFNKMSKLSYLVRVKNNLKTHLDILKTFIAIRCVHALCLM